MLFATRMREDPVATPRSPDVPGCPRMCPAFFNNHIKASVIKVHFLVAVPQGHSS